MNERNKMNEYAVNHTPYNSTRFYVSKMNERARKFLQSICFWGDSDHEINGYIGFEVKREVFTSVANIMNNAFNMVLTPEILH